MKFGETFCGQSADLFISDMILQRYETAMWTTSTTSFLPPANEVRAGYVFTPVCHSVHGRGVSASVHAGIHLQRSRHPQEADTPRK